MKKPRHSELLAIALSVAALASIASHGKTEVSLEDEAAQALANDLNERVFTVTKPFYVYHWYTKVNLSSPYESGDPNRAASAEEIQWLKSATEWKVQRMTDRFWNELSPYGLVGAGMYCARDPLSSNRYGYDYDHMDQAGWNDPVVLSLRIDPGAKLFDLRAIAPKDPSEYAYGNLIYLRDATVDQLKEAGCTVAAAASIRDAWWGKPECGRILAAALKSLGVVANVHSWWGGGLANCMNKPDAFVIYDSGYFNSDNRVRFYTRQTVRDPTFTGFPDAEERKKEWAAMNSLADENRNSNLYEGSSDGFRILLKTDDLGSVPRLSPEELAAWKRDHLFHCDESAPEEKTKKPNFLK